MEFPLEAAYPHVWKGLNSERCNTSNLDNSWRNIGSGTVKTVLSVISQNNGLTVSEIEELTGLTRRQVQSAIYANDGIFNISDNPRKAIYVKGEGRLLADKKEP